MNGIDNNGNRLDSYKKVGDACFDQYFIMTDVNFERRLHAFDPSLVLLFDQQTKRWMILQEADDKKNFTIVMTLEDRDGNPKPAGEWVFNKLYVMKKKWEETMDKGADWWMANQQNQVNSQTEAVRQKTSRENIDRTKDNFNQFRRMIADLQNEPVSDVTAGYQKITNKTKGKVYG